MDIWEVIESQRRQGEPIVVATVAAGRGSVPGETGAKAVVSGAGLIAGTLGGGKIEARALAEAATVLAGGPACVMRTWNLQRDIGMTCGGEMTLLFERISPGQEWHIVIFGAGHVAQALVRLLATLRCRIDVVDERPEWLARLPEAENIARHRVAAFEDGVSLVGGGSFVLSISKGHATDRPVLREVLRRHPEIPYLGVIGSAAKRAVLRRELAEDAIPEDLLDKIICPLGLAVGGNDPAEIAVSIAAQLLQRRDVLISDATGRSPV
jgi:xanthine dehydrogenase accessory factor